MAQWLPKDPRLSLLPFLQKASLWTSADPQCFLQHAILLCNSKGCVSLVQHPVVKQLLLLYQKLMTAAAGDEGLEMLSKQILLDARLSDRASLNPKP